MNHQYSDETRRRLCGHVNYRERTCDIAAVPHDFSGSRWLLETTPAHIIFYGDPGPGKKLTEALRDCLKEDGSDMTRERSIADKWSIRRSLTFAQIADVIVGSETGPLNSVAMEEHVKGWSCYRIPARRI